MGEIFSRSSWWVEAVELAVVALLVTRMVLVGFLQPPGRVLSWPMFSRGCAVVIDLKGKRNGRYEEINIFDHLPSGHFSITSTELQWLVDHLSETYEEIQGAGRIFYSEGESEVKVVDGHVVV
ncbi:hypothetical protein ACFVFS_19980 [Kitasatospora sp. NPDC057692]|uniref:hypothetical protein n=1 Tax=Kitasatospora sp. NPDC057692 TaxID=3346215 RepID=UPI00368297BD